MILEKVKDIQGPTGEIIPMTIEEILKIKIPISEEVFLKCLAEVVVDTAKKVDEIYNLLPMVTDVKIGNEYDNPPGNHVGEG
jgi:hypothetical protein